MSSSQSTNSRADYVDAWVWIHVPEWQGLEEMLWEALESLKTSNYTIYLQDPKTLDNEKRFLVMKVIMKKPVNLWKRSKAVEAQLRDDIDEILKVLELERGAYGTPLSDGEPDADGVSESETESEPKSKAQLRPKFSSPVPTEVDSDEGGFPTPATSDADGDFGNDYDKDHWPFRPGRNSFNPFESGSKLHDIFARSDDGRPSNRTEVQSNTGNNDTCFGEDAEITYERVYQQDNARILFQDASINWRDNTETNERELQALNELRAINDRRRVGNVYNQKNSRIMYQGGH